MIFGCLIDITGSFRKGSFDIACIGSFAVTIRGPLAMTVMPAHAHDILEVAVGTGSQR